MDQDKKAAGQTKGPEWVSGQDLSFKNVVSYLHALKAGVEGAIEHQKKELQRYVAARDSIRKP